MKNMIKIASLILLSSLSTYAMEEKLEQSVLVLTDDTTVEGLGWGTWLSDRTSSSAIYTNVLAEIRSDTFDKKNVANLRRLEQAFEYTLKSSLINDAIVLERACLEKNIKVKNEEVKALRRYINESRNTNEKEYKSTVQTEVKSSNEQIDAFVKKFQESLETMKVELDNIDKDMTVRLEKLSTEKTTIISDLTDAKRRAKGLYATRVKDGYESENEIDYAKESVQKKIEVYKDIQDLLEKINNIKLSVGYINTQSKLPLDGPIDAAKVAKNQ